MKPHPLHTSSSSRLVRWGGAALGMVAALASGSLAAQTAQTAAPAAAPATATTTAAPATGCATVNIDNVRPQQGQLMLAAYGDAATYGKKPMVALRVPAGEARMQVQLCGLSGTQVALMLYQDLDSDGKMARNLMGLPTEPWGSSGNPGMFGPQWDTGKVALDGSPIAVKMSL